MGETKLIKEIIRKKISIQPFLNVYHLDTKKQGDFSSRDGQMFISEYAPKPFTTGGNRMVWLPLIDDIDEYSKFFLSILQAGLPAIVNIDESINMKFGTAIPRGLSILSAQGRLPGIHVLAGTQELARAPRQLLSQAWHVISFNVFNDYDERMILKYLRMKGETELGLKQYEFMYLRPDVDATARKFNTYQDFLPIVN